MVDRRAVLQARCTRQLVLENGVVSADAVGVFDNVADPQIVQLDIDGLAPVVHPVFQFGFALQHVDPGAAKLADRNTVANQVERVQRELWSLGSKSMDMLPAASTPLLARALTATCLNVVLPFASMRVCISFSKASTPPTALCGWREA